MSPITKGQHGGDMIACGLGGLGDETSIIQLIISVYSHHA